MDNKEQVLRLYERMNNINHNLGIVTENIDYLKDCLSSSFVVDDKIVHESEINENREKIRDLKISSKFDVIEDLRNYL